MCEKKCKVENNRTLKMISIGEFEKKFKTFSDY